MQTIRYGAAASQEGDLHLPAGQRPPVVCLLHGGFWRLPYGRAEMSPIAEDLAARGFAVWNLEYRRLGEPGGGWPGTLQDVAAGIDHLSELVAMGADLDLARVAVVGHSAGGHLALWSAARDRRPLVGAAAARVCPMAAAGLAPMADLVSVYAVGAGNRAVEELLGGTLSELPERYFAASPLDLLPLGVPQLLVHGTADRHLPIEFTSGYARAALAAGDIVELVEVPDMGHMEFLDPTSAPHTILCRWLRRLTEDRQERDPRPAE